MAAVSSAYAQRLIMTLFFISFGIYLFLATVTYTPFDPGWMHVSSDTQQVSNASGVAGAWIADMLFGFLGWSALLIPLFFFIEAIQVWWPRSFLTRPFRYAAQFFLILVTATLFYLFWQVPADTLDNASGGIIGYELGKSLSNLLTIYGASLFLLGFFVLLLTLAFGIQWNKTWAMLRVVPKYVQDLFYKNIPEQEAVAAIVHDQPSATLKSDIRTSVAPQAAMAPQSEISLQPAANLPEGTSAQADESTRKLLQDLALAEGIGQVGTQPKYQLHSQSVADEIDDVELEKTLAKAHQLEKDTQRLVATGEVWRAFQQHDDHNKDEIEALLKAADADVLVSSGEPNEEPVMHEQHQSQTLQSVVSPNKVSAGMDWDDDEIFDELLAVVPGETADRKSEKQSLLHEHEQTLEQQQLAKEWLELSAEQEAAVKQETALTPDVSHVHREEDSGSVLPVATVAAATSVAPALAHAMPTAASKAQEFDDLLLDVFEASEPSAVHLETHGAMLTSPAHVDSGKTELSKEEFIEAWQETAGKLEPDAPEWDDLDAPLTDSHGRPMSRAMQVVERRKDLSPLPEFSLLDKVDPNKKVNFTEAQLQRLSELLEIKLQEFNVKAQVVEAQPGPVVTRFELNLAPGVKASKVTNISRDLARSMSMASVRVVEVIPGKPYIGIEVPNSAREMVRLTELLDTPDYRDPAALISMAMGKDISGRPVLTDLAKAPHMLVAGTTGSGKSVAVNSMLLSMLLKYKPEQLRLILIDPKQLELANYNDIPHLLTPVVTDMKDAVSALNWCVNEMERRYKLMSFLKIRKITDYNRKVEEAIANGEDLIDPTWKPSDSATQQRAPRLTPLPMIVIVADEFADMIMQVGKKAEEMITRLAQKSRAAGIHLLLATQRPSVDVITGLIKANIPTRVALRVNSKIDSRTILDAGGAEDLLGHGDMLFLGPGKIEPERVHGAFISDDEVNRICDAWRERGSPNYVDEILTPFDEEPTSRGFEDGDSSDRDVLYDQAVAFVLETRKASTSSLQRKFSLGYNRAARLIDTMEENGIVSAMGPNGKREILV